MEFDGRVVIVTGAAGNLGRAVAQTFAARGARLVLVDLRPESLDNAFGAAGGLRLFAPANLLDQGQADAVAARAMERFGRIDVLANLAGGFRMGEPVHATSDATWNFLFDINARTLLHMARAVVPRLLAGGGGASSTSARSPRRRAWRRWAPTSRPRAR
jgi:NAD(P)-dependent dehydrogenase (short-subunit alcohol dehydrogenase family)